MPSACQGRKSTECNPPSCRWASGPKGRSFCRAATNVSRKGSPKSTPSSSRASSPTIPPSYKMLPNSSAPRKIHPGPVKYYKGKQGIARKGSARKGITEKYAIANATPYVTFPTATAVPYPFRNDDLPLASSVQPIVQANSYYPSKKKQIAPSGVMLGGLPSEFIEPLDDIPLPGSSIQEIRRRSRRSRRSRRRSRR